MFTDMFDALDEGRAPRETFYDGYVVNAIVDACYRSAESRSGNRFSSTTGAAAAFPGSHAAGAQHDGKTVIKEETMPDGRRKLILKDEATGEFVDVVPRNSVVVRRQRP